MRASHRVFIRALVVLAIVAPVLVTNIALGAAQQSQPAALFADATPTAGYDLPAGAIRARFVQLNLAALGPATGHGPVADPADLLLNLFEDAAYTAVAHSVVSPTEGKLVWQGAVPAIPGATVIFAVSGEAVAGTIHLGGELYKVGYAGEGVHVVQQVGLAEPLPLAPPREVSLPPTEAPTEAALADSGDVIDVMVVYTPASRIANGGPSGIAALIALAVAETNQAYVNSQVNTQLNLVHTAEVAYSESGDMGRDLDRLTYTSDGHIDVVHTWRNTYHADQVTLIEESSQYCGTGWLMRTESSAFQSYAFTVVDSSCATGYYSYGHELGHNQGLTHDRANASVSGAFPYAYGYWLPNSSPWPAYLYRTIMAYSCPTGCTRIQYFSNPSVSYLGVATGVDHGADPAHSADNARALNQTRDTVANWRQSASCTAPGAASSPSPANGASGVSINANLDWANASGAASYDVYFGTAATPPFVANVAASAYDLPALSSNTDYYWKIVARNSCGNTPGPVWHFRTGATGNNPPENVNLWPDHGGRAAGRRVNFTATHRDLDGWRDLSQVYLHIGSSTAARNNCRLRYDVRKNKMYLASNAGTAWLGGFAPGSAKVIRNRQCTLSCAKSTVTKSGRVLRVKWNLVFRTSFRGRKNSYMRAADIPGAKTAWELMGTWRVQ